MRRRKIIWQIMVFTFFLIILFYKDNDKLASNSDVQAFNNTAIRYLIPSGQLIGVKLNVEGIFVVGFSDIKNSKISKQSPALMNGIQMGDCIYGVDGKKINSSKQLAFYVKNSKGNNLNLTIKRKLKIFTKSVKPVMSSLDKTYKIGLWVRDSTAGVGTLTFFDPVTNKFGALGHPVNDIDTGLLLPIKDGKIYNAEVIAVQIGEKGKPGELKGIFSENNAVGELNKNTIEGIYGNITTDKQKIYNKYNAMPIGEQREVTLGPAKIIASIDKYSPKYYDVYIEKLTKQNKPDSKGIVIRITDKELLKKTGGIVQGMSGCPIIQNGKIIGAVTHVLVNRPDMGYGIYIQWMLNQLEKSE